MADDKRLCPQCSQYMILTETGITLTSYPPQHPQIWWCGCGYTASARNRYEKTQEELRHDAWKQANEPPHAP